MGAPNDAFVTRREVLTMNSLQNEESNSHRSDEDDYQSRFDYCCSCDTGWIHVGEEREKSTNCPPGEGNAYRYCPARSLGHTSGTWHGWTTWIRSFYGCTRTANGSEQYSYQDGGEVRKVLNRETSQQVPPWADAQAASSTETSGFPERWWLKTDAASTIPVWVKVGQW